MIARGGTGGATNTPGNTATNTTLGSEGADFYNNSTGTATYDGVAVAQNLQ